MLNEVRRHNVRTNSYDAWLHKPNRNGRNKLRDGLNESFDRMNSTEPVQRSESLQ